MEIHPLQKNTDVNMTPEILNLKITRNDIFDYAVKNTLYHPIERYIDPIAYDIDSVSILNRQTKERTPQLKDYQSFYQQLENLKKNAKEMQTSEILQLCEELEEIAPKTINL